MRDIIRWVIVLWLWCGCSVATATALDADTCTALLDAGVSGETLEELLVLCPTLSADALAVHVLDYRP